MSGTLRYERPKVEKRLPIRALMGGINLSINVPPVLHGEVHVNF